MGWFKAVSLRGRRYEDAAISIQEHLAERIEELMADGMSQRDAEATARREFGNLTLVEERCREVWGWPRIENVWADVKYAVRQLRKAPGFAVTAVLTLALGIAVNATMFSLVSAFLLPRLPAKNPERLVVISSVRPTPGDFSDINLVSAANFATWRADRRIFSQMAAADDNRAGSLTWQGRPEAIRYAAVSPDYFTVFGSAPVLGRSFLQGEDQPGRDHVIVLSHGLWTRRFASDPSVIGRIVHLNRENYTVVGVMGENFRLLGFTPQLWTPLQLNAADQRPAARKNRFLYVFARLAPGATLEQARAEVQGLAKRAGAEYPTVEKHWGAAVRSLQDYLIYSFGIRKALSILMTTVGFVLLIACCNVAGLSLTRAVGRQKELAIRVSLGAARARLIWQLLTEGTVIAFFGGTVGLVLTYFGIALLRANCTFNAAMSAVPITLDRAVLLFAAGVSFLSAVLSSVIPALNVARAEVNVGLRSESRAASSGIQQNRLRSFLVAGEIALALFLVTGTCLLVRAIYLLDHQKLGFRTDHILTAGMALDHARYGDSAQQLAFARTVLSRLQRIAGVEGVAIASDLPGTGPDSVAIRMKDRPDLSTDEHRSALSVVVTPSYFRVADISLLRGRTFSDMDDLSAPRVVLVNQEFVHRYLNDEQELGKQVLLEHKDTVPAWAEIVGVVGNAKGYVQDTGIPPEVYETFLQRPLPSFALMIHCGIDPAGLTPALYGAIHQLDPDLPLANVMTMDRVIERQKNGNPLFTRMLGTFASLALILAAIGVYGLIAYSAGQRAHEIGIRMALGAERSDVRRMILQNGLKLSLAGCSVGLMLALPLPKLFDAMFRELHTAAPVLYVIALAAIFMVTLCASYIPARRAAHIDPVSILHSQ